MRYAIPLLPMNHISAADGSAAPVMAVEAHSRKTVLIAVNAMLFSFRRVQPGRKQRGEFEAIKNPEGIRYRTEISGFLPLLSFSRYKSAFRI